MSSQPGTPAPAPQNCQTEMMVEKPDNFKHVPLQSEPAAQHRIVESADLFHGTNEIMIRHDGSVYRLKITRQGKLILNK
ncbi:hemin uptake protein HemP [Rhizobium leguminosarum]|nr:hemin uptake protein HemP [Rhizobium leguminosarum]